MFVEFIEEGGDNANKFLKFIEKPIEIKTVPTSIIDTIKKSQTPPQTPMKPNPHALYLMPVRKKGLINLSKVSVFMTPEKIKEEKKEKTGKLKKVATEYRLKKEKEEREWQQLEFENALKIQKEEKDKKAEESKKKLEKDQKAEEKKRKKEKMRKREKEKARGRKKEKIRN